MSLFATGSLSFCVLGTQTTLSLNNRSWDSTSMNLDFGCRSPPKMNVSYLFSDRGAKPPRRNQCTVDRILPNMFASIELGFRLERLRRKTNLTTAGEITPYVTELCFCASFWEEAQSFLAVTRRW